MIHPYQYCESDFDTIQKLLYNCKRENKIDFDNISPLSEEEEMLFSPNRFSEREDY